MDANVILAQATRSLSPKAGLTSRGVARIADRSKERPSSKAIGVSRGSGNIECGDAREVFCHACRFPTERIQIISYEWREHALTPAV